MSAQQPSVVIDIVSDVIWPWCFVGKRHLEEAIHSFKNELKFEITWKPFFLNPNTPDTGVPLLEYLAQKYGPQAVKTAAEGTSPLSKAGRNVGINFDSNRNIVNTLKSHCLLDYAKGLGKQDAVAENLFKSYFEDGQNINSVDVLSKIAVESGLDPTAATQQIQDSGVMSRVKQEALEARGNEINGVPHFIIHLKGDKQNVLSFSGAQPIDTFKRVFQKFQNKMKSNV